MVYHTLVPGTNFCIGVPISVMRHMAMATLINENIYWMVYSLRELAHYHHGGTWLYTDRHGAEA